MGKIGAETPHGMGVVNGLMLRPLPATVRMMPSVETERTRRGEFDAVMYSVPSRPIAMSSQPTSFALVAWSPSPSPSAGVPPPANVVMTPAPSTRRTFAPSQITRFSSRSKMTSVGPESFAVAAETPSAVDVPAPTAVVMMPSTPIRRMRRSVLSAM